MRRTVSLLVSGACLVGLFAATAAPPAAAALGCPNNMTLTPAAAVRQGDKKDKNQNTFICTQPTTCVQSTGNICQGGPDDQFYGSAPLLGTDGNWYYVLDDI